MFNNIASPLSKLSNIRWMYSTGRRFSCTIFWVGLDGQCLFVFCAGIQALIAQVIKTLVFRFCKTVSL